MNKPNFIRSKTLGLLMLALLFISFVSQLVNEWYAHMKFVLNLSQPQKNSFKLGLKFAAKGFLLPFLPRKHWSTLIIPAASSQAKSKANTRNKTKETEFVRVDNKVKATVVPLLGPSPSSPAIQAPGERGKGLKVDAKNDLKKLRELARASFYGHLNEGVTNNSYRFRLQSLSPETISNDPQTSSSKVIYE